jgi:hypothetical protein
MRIVPDSPGNKSKDLARSTSPAHAGHQSPDRLLALEDEQELRQRLDLWHHPASRSFSSKVLTGLVYSLPEQAVYTLAENDKAERQISLASSILESDPDPISANPPQTPPAFEHVVKDMPAEESRGALPDRAPLAVLESAAKQASVEAAVVRWAPDSCR